MNSATREAYGAALAELGNQNPDVVALDADLAGSTKSAIFGKAHPDRFFDMGIAEADMIGTAAGLATCGKIPFASSFAVFCTGRAFEQIRNSVCNPELNVTVVGSHAGPSCGEDGSSHQAMEDIAIMRSLPNMCVVVPADDVEAYAATLALGEYVGPAYLRVARLASPTIHDEDYEFDLMHGDLLREGDDVTVVACGMMVPRALEAADQLAEQGISAQVVNMHTIKPIDVELLEACARKTGKVITIEEGSVVGGLGTAVAEALSERYPVPVRRIGVMDVFGTSGSGAELLDYYGLNAAHIVDVAHELCD
ncbi:MAG: transketolase family protein [Coriobacteriales bacterium]|nr:transketolase family protein [Coriobacteriales bacterium]